ncbi:MAG: nitrous oxide reductase accessory protein NosL [Thermomonas sp.]
MRLTPATWAAAALTMLVLLAACYQAAPPAPPPSPAEVSDAANGRYCGMQLTDHDGPKGQIFVIGIPDPIWFSSVRDTIAFLRLPEESSDVAAVFVNDMGKAKNWKQPEAGAWVEANSAWFVLDSNMRGGMGAPEAVPFAAKPAAEAFRAEHGGRLARLVDIPDAYVLGPVDLTPIIPGTADDVVDAPVDSSRPADGHDAADVPAQLNHSGH